jgi:hypothetical protein
VARKTGRGSSAHDDEVDQLFQMPLSEFTAARNALATKLKQTGDTDTANRVKTLAKPSVSAWVANQLYWRNRNAFDRLLAAGDEFRKAQIAQLSGQAADLRPSLDARREALAELSKDAAATLRDAGHPASPDTMRRITTTLEALATYGDQPDAPHPGRLTSDVDPPGFEALAALVPRGGDRVGHRHAAPRVIPFGQPKPESARRRSDRTEPGRRRDAERRARQAEARAALREAHRSLADARKTAERARTAMKHAAARAKSAEQAKAELESHIEKAIADLEAARQEARRVAAQAEEAAQAVDDAERAVAAAKAAAEDDG